jgi:uncharacterized protein
MEKATARMSLKNFAANHPLVAFFALAFGITWGGWALLLATRSIASCSTMCILYPGWGPSIAAVIMAVLIGGRIGLGNLMRSLLRWRVGLQWYVVALFVALAVVFTSIGIAMLFFGKFTDSSFSPYWYTPFLALFPAIGIHFIFSGLPEELGWRGFALPQLMAKHSVLVASLILGIFEGLWHLPNYTILSPFSPLIFAIFFLNVLAVGIFRAWLYVNTNRSTFIVTLFHGALDATGAIFLAGVGKNFGTVFIIITIVFWIIALAIVIKSGSDLGFNRTKEKMGIIK